MSLVMPLGKNCSATADVSIDTGQTAQPAIAASHRRSPAIASATQTSAWPFRSTDTDPQVKTGRPPNWLPRSSAKRWTCRAHG